MADTNKTTADIIAAMRDYSNACNDGYHTDYNVVRADMCKYADRFEAALKRERGYYAKLRKALSDACYAMFNFLKMQTGGYEEMAQALDQAKTALAATSSQNTLEVNRSGEVERAQET